MTYTSKDVDAVVDHVRDNWAPADTWEFPEAYGYPTSLALCVIDAIQSMGVRYATVQNVVARYREEHGTTDGAAGLVASTRASSTGPRSLETATRCRRDLVPL